MPPRISPLTALFVYASASPRVIDAGDKQAAPSAYECIFNVERQWAFHHNHGGKTAKNVDTTFR